LCAAYVEVVTEEEGCRGVERTERA